EARRGQHEDDLVHDLAVEHRDEVLERAEDLRRAAEGAARAGRRRRALLRTGLRVEEPRDHALAEGDLALQVARHLERRGPRPGARAPRPPWIRWGIRWWIRWETRRASAGSGPARRCSWAFASYPNRVMIALATAKSSAFRAREQRPGRFEGGLERRVARAG